MINKLYCFSLERTTVSQEFYCTRLPCSRDEAHEFLALTSSTKSLMLPPEADAAYRISGTPFFIRKISTWEKIHHLFDSLYPLPAEERWFHLRRRIIAFLPVVLQLARLERAVPETIFEIFTPTDAFLFKGPPSESITDGLVLAQIRFWSPRDNFTLVGIRFGWKDDTQLGYVYRLYSFIESYINNIIDLFDPTGDKFFFNLPSIPPNVDETTSDEISTKPLTNPAAIFEEIDGIMMGTPRASMGLEEKYKITKLPRFYTTTVTKICQLVAFRQLNINNENGIKDLGETLEEFGPSYNTLRKLPKLLANWYNPGYRWYVDHWLREHTGHTPGEISQILSDLREQLTDEDWDLVISTANEKPAKGASKNGTRPMTSHS